jgi:hypothetical protein
MIRKFMSPQLLQWWYLRNTNSKKLMMKKHTCVIPPLKFPPANSIEISVVTTPPLSSLIVLRMVARIAFSMLPYVVPCPRSIAWMNE